MEKIVDSFEALEIEQQAKPLRDRDDIYETFYEGTRKKIFVGRVRSLSSGSRAWRTRLKIIFRAKSRAPLAQQHPWANVVDKLSKISYLRN